jgi:hypothetical protein
MTFMANPLLRDARVGGIARLRATARDPDIPLTPTDPARAALATAHR